MALLGGAIDVPGYGMLGVVGLGQIVGWVMMGRAMSRDAVKRATERGAEEARENEALAELAKANANIAKSLEALQTWQREHERQDDRREGENEKRWAVTEQIMKQQADLLAELREARAPRRRIAGA